MTNAIAIKTEFPAYRKPEGSTGARMKSESDKPIDSAEATIDNDSLRYITKLIDTIEAFNKNLDLDLQTKNKEQSLAEESRLEE